MVPIGSPVRCLLLFETLNVSYFNISKILSDVPRVSKVPTVTHEKFIRVPSVTHEQFLKNVIGDVPKVLSESIASVRDDKAKSDP